MAYTQDWENYPHQVTTGNYSRASISSCSTERLLNVDAGNEDFYCETVGQHQERSLKNSLRNKHQTAYLHFTSKLFLFIILYRDRPFSAFCFETFPRSPSLRQFLFCIPLGHYFFFTSLLKIIPALQPCDETNHYLKVWKKGYKKYPHSVFPTPSVSIRGNVCTYSSIPGHIFKVPWILEVSNKYQTHSTKCLIEANQYSHHRTAHCNVSCAPRVSFKEI